MKIRDKLSINALNGKQNPSCYTSFKLQTTNKDVIASDNAFASKARQKQVNEVNFSPNSTN